MGTCMWFLLMLPYWPPEVAYDVMEINTYQTESWPQPEVQYIFFNYEDGERVFKCWMHDHEGTFYGKCVRTGYITLRPRVIIESHTYFDQCRWHTTVADKHRKPAKRE